MTSFRETHGVLWRSHRLLLCALYLLLLTSLFLPFIANDKPLLIRYQGNFYMPIFYEYAETAFGGEFQNEANYRDSFVRTLIEKDGWIIWPVVPFSYDTINYESHLSFPAPPSAENWLGTDEYGRDLLARLLYGVRASLFYGVIVAFFSVILALVLGILQGYFKGWIDFLLQRFIEVWAGIPLLFVLMILAAYNKTSFFSLMVIMIGFKWLMLVQIVRAEVLRCMTQNYVMSAQLMGFTKAHIMLRYVLPHVLHTVYAMFPFVVISAIAVLTTLDFLGLGLPPSMPSLGEVLNEAKHNLHAPWIGIFSFCTLSGVLLLFVYLGESFKEIFHPQHALNIDHW